MVLRDPLVHVQVTKGEGRESGLGAITPESKSRFVFVLFRVGCARGAFAFLLPADVLVPRLPGCGCWRRERLSAAVTFAVQMFLACGPR